MLQDEVFLTPVVKTGGKTFLPELFRRQILSGIEDFNWKSAPKAGEKSCKRMNRRKISIHSAKITNILMNKGS